MTIDIHANLYHPDWYPEAFTDSVVEEFIHQQVLAGKQAMSAARARASLKTLLPDRDGSRSLKLMDEVGLERKVIMIMDWGMALGEAALSIEEVNREILGVCQAHPDRLTGFVGIDPRRPDAPAMVARAIDLWGAGGLKLHPTTGWKLDDDEALAVVAVAVERGLPALVHTGNTIERLSDEFCRPHHMIELARHFPRGRFIAAHAAFDRWREFGQHGPLPDNLHCDISGWQSLVGNDQEKLDTQLTELMKIFNGRVHFGTDGPFFSYNLPASEQHWLRMVSTFVAAHPELPGIGNMLDSSALLAQ